MLVQIGGHERTKYGKHFATMFHHRKIIFHDQRKWDVKVTDDHYEIDEYDREETSYLMSFDEKGDLVGSIRLISTIMPHMMSGPFSKMFPDISFKSPVIWEGTRFAVHGDRAVQPNLVSTAACEIMLGTVQFGLQHGVRHITAVYDAGMSRLYRRCGFTNFELGRFRTAEHGTVFVGLCEITDELEASVRAATGLLDSEGPQPPHRIPIGRDDADALYPSRRAA